MTPQQFSILLGKYKQGILNTQERVLFFQAVAEGGFEDLLGEDMLARLREDTLPETGDWTTEKEDQELERLLSVLDSRKLQGTRRLRRIWWAAAACLGLGLFSWLLVSRERSSGTQPIVEAHSEIMPPEHNRPVLTLADGRQIELEDGELAVEENGADIRQQGASLAYIAGESTGVPVYNTLSTPRGRQFQIVFSDGTKAWLNSASSLRYPTAFSGKQRVVELTGQAYFEVAKDATRPFLVRANGVEVRVLGTQFDVMAYPDEGQIQTTLLEGSVEVSKDGEHRLLTPGQQAAADNGRMWVRHVDVSRAIAWKNGLFVFNNTSLSAIMREISRWYDIEWENPELARQVADLYGGSISRKRSLQEVLKLLEADGKMRFEILGRDRVKLVSH